MVMIERTASSREDERLLVEQREGINEIEQDLVMLSVVDAGANADQVAIVEHGCIRFIRRAHLRMKDICDRIRDFFRIAVVNRNTDNDRFHTPLSSSTGDNIFELKHINGQKDVAEWYIRYFMNGLQMSHGHVEKR